MSDTEADIPAIVSLIYENIFAPKTWSGFVEIPSPRDQEKGAPSQTAETLDSETLDTLLPHLESALALGANEQDLNSPRAQRLALFEELPLPICIVSRDLLVLSTTSKAGDELLQSAMLSLKDGRVYSADRQFARRLADAVVAAVDTGESRALSYSREQGKQETILVSSVPWNSGSNNQSAAALFLNFEPNATKGLSKALMDCYGLTRSEAEVTAYLVQGLSLKEISKIKGASVHTVRTQIKTVFGKTGTSRQGELVSLVMNGPATWLRLLTAVENQRSSAEFPTDVSFLQLADGRMLCFGDYGPKDGTPVVMFHHLLGSRMDKPERDGVLDRLGIRLIVPERPGVGLSSPSAVIGLAGGTDDIRQLADHLEIERFHALGFSSGGPFAAACAAFLTDRVIKLGLVASLMPVDELPAGTHIGLLQQFFTGMARHWPSGAQALLEFRYRKLLEHPDEGAALFKTAGSSADIELYREPEMSRIRLRNLRAAAKLPKSVFARELVVLSRPWGFQISDLRIPVLLWHGRQDDYFSVEQAEAIAEIIPGCRTTIRDDWGHFFLHREWERILEDLVQ